MSIDQLAVGIVAGTGMGVFLGWKIHLNFGPQIIAVVAKYQESQRKKKLGRKSEGSTSEHPVTNREPSVRAGGGAPSDRIPLGETMPEPRESVPPAP